MLHELEHKMALYIDKLLVSNKIEKPRRFIKAFPGKDYYYIQDYIRVKSPARLTVDINFEFNCAVVKYDSLCWCFNLQSGKSEPSSAKMPDVFCKIFPYIQQCIRRFQSEIAQQRKKYEQYKDWKSVSAEEFFKQHNK